jgi:hypothetical protein
MEEWRYSATILDLGTRRFTPWEKAPGTQWIGGWVGPRAGLDAVEKRKISCPCWESNPGRPSRGPLLYRLCIETDLAAIISIFLTITPCSPVKGDRYFLETCCLHLQGRRLSQPLNSMNQTGSACCLLHAGFLLGLLFDPENRDDMFLRNVGWLSTVYTALHPRRQHTF